MEISTKTLVIPIRTSAAVQSTLGLQIGLQRGTRSCLKLAQGAPFQVDGQSAMRVLTGISHTSHSTTEAETSNWTGLCLYRRSLVEAPQHSFLCAEASRWMNAFERVEESMGPV